MTERKEILLPAVDTEEVFRYAGIPKTARDPRLLSPYLELCHGVDRGKVCWTTLSVCREGCMLDLGTFSVSSRDLSSAVDGCSSILLFGATLGPEFDRILRRSMASDLAGTVFLQAIGTERIEALCDAFCREQTAALQPQGLSLTPRFSPGYGDLPLQFQRDVFRILDCSRSIGLTLTDSCLMIPSKSVTALVGIYSGKRAENRTGCRSCGKTDCIYRKAEP